MESIKYKYSEDIDRLYQDAANDFMQGKYQIAYDNLRKLRSMLTNESKGK